MAIALVAAVACQPVANDGGTSSAIDTTGANFLVISVGWYSTAAPAVSDSKGNTWVPLTQYAYFSDSRQRFYYCFTPTVGSGHTFTVTGTDSYLVFHARAYSGVGSYQTESGSSVGVPLATGSVTPSANGALILSGFCALNPATDSLAPAGFTLSQITMVPGTTMQNTVGDYVQPTAAAINPTWNWSGGSHTSSVAATAVFLPALPAGTSTKWRLNVASSNDASYIGIAKLAMAATIGGTDLCTGGTPSASSVYSPAYAASMAFDTNASTYWSSAGGVTAASIQYDFASAVAITEYTITAPTGVGAHYEPKSWTFEYWDGSGWVVVDTRSAQTGWAYGEVRTFDFGEALAVARVSQFVVETLSEIPPPPAPLQITQLLVEVLDVLPFSPLVTSQVAAEILFIGTPLNAARVTQICYELIIIPQTIEENCPADSTVFPIDSDI